MNNTDINDGVCSGDAVSFPRGSNRIWNLHEFSKR